ncbi:WD40-repeat-containing domain protein [Phlyctochytrium arcticum]|nr:WD40-repeat-containing domain protein [Phlyctochytrium arcticum]
MKINSDTTTGAAQNGSSSSTNGRAVVQLKNGREEELVRLIVQSLQDLGLKESAEAVQKESGTCLETTAVKEFRQGVLSGDWAAVEKLLPTMKIKLGDSDAVFFLIRKQKYLEHLESRQISQALSVLREELAKMDIEPPILQELASYIMCPNTDVLREKAKWDGAKGTSRTILLHDLQKHVASAMMIPDRRLDELLNQAIQLQKMNCLYHNVESESTSLFVDHSCDRNRFPCITTHIFEEHADEVWFLSFSHDGNYLASASKDMTAAIWSVVDWRLTQVMAGHTNAISFLSWSPDDSKLLTASNDNTLKVWNTRTGTCINTFSRHTDTVTACAWLPSGEQFISGSVDKHIYIWSLDGAIIHKWSNVRATDLAVARDGSVLLANSEKKIRIYNLQDKTEMGSLPESDSITSINIAADCRHVLVNLSTQEVHLWDLQERRLVRKYIGQKQGRFVIRSCFGGLHQNFILSGSEDSLVYVWHRERGVLIESLPGHSGCVNCISWNPKRNMFASASDDHTIRVWGLPSSANGNTSSAPALLKNTTNGDEAMSTEDREGSGVQS